MAHPTPDWRRFDRIRVADAAERIRGVVRRTPLVPLACDDARVELLAKLENRQETGSFKARGAWNNIALLTDAERRAGVVTSSSGNHGRALAWAARRGGVRATIVMPANAYPNKVQACRDEGAEVVLCPTRREAEAEVRRRVEAGAVLIPPFDAERTVQGAGTVGLEIAAERPDADLVVVPVGGGGLISGVALALRQTLGARVAVLGAEPEGAPTLTRALAAGRPVEVDEITTSVQGLCPLACGALNVEICRAAVDAVVTLDDETIHAAQARLVALGEVVEPAGAAAAAAVLAGRLPEPLLGRLLARAAGRRLVVVAVVSGGNPDPAQLERVRAQAGALAARESSGEARGSAGASRGSAGTSRGPSGAPRA